MNLLTKHKKIVAWLMMFAMILGSLASSNLQVQATEPPETFFDVSISFTKENGDPVENNQLSVNLVKDGSTYMGSQNGNYDFSFSVPAGTYEVEITSDKFTSDPLNVMVADDSTFTFSLNSKTESSNNENTTNNSSSTNSSEDSSEDEVVTSTPDPGLVFRAPPLRGTPNASGNGWVADANGSVESVSGTWWDRYTPGTVIPGSTTPLDTFANVTVSQQDYYWVQKGHWYVNVTGADKDLTSVITVTTSQGTYAGFCLNHDRNVPLGAITNTPTELSTQIANILGYYKHAMGSLLPPETPMGEATPAVKTYLACAVLVWHVLGQWHGESIQTFLPKLGMSWGTVEEIFSGRYYVTDTYAVELDTGNDNYQKLAILTGVTRTPGSETKPTTDVHISMESGTVSESSTTTYGARIHKTAIQTNENLSDISFTVTESVAANPQGSPDVRPMSPASVTVTTGANGIATFTAPPKSASWTASYSEISDLESIKDYVANGNPSQAFLDLYNAKVSQSSGSKASAQAAVQAKKNAFEAIKYKYTFSEISANIGRVTLTDMNGNTITDISLPKVGYRNNHKGSAVSTIGGSGILLEITLFDDLLIVKPGDGVDAAKINSDLTKESFDEALSDANIQSTDYNISYIHSDDNTIKTAINNKLNLSNLVSSIPNSYTNPFVDYSNDIVILENGVQVFLNNDTLLIYDSTFSDYLIETNFKQSFFTAYLSNKGINISDFSKIFVITSSDTTAAKIKDTLQKPYVDNHGNPVEDSEYKDKVFLDSLDAGTVNPFYSYTNVSNAFVFFAGTGQDYVAETVDDFTTPSTVSTGAVSNGGTGSAKMTNQPWRNAIFLNKTDLETHNQIVHDTIFEIYEWNGSGWGSANENYDVVRITEAIKNQMKWGDESVGLYTVHRKKAADSYTGTTFSKYKPYGWLYYTQKNQGKFKIVEKQAPHYSDSGYVGNFVRRPYEKLGGQTQKSQPPVDVPDDYATIKREHEIQLCVETDIYQIFMLVDSTTLNDAIYNPNRYFGERFVEDTESYTVINVIGNDSVSRHYPDPNSDPVVMNISATHYIGDYVVPNINYNSYAGTDAEMLNTRFGFNKSGFIKVDSPTRNFKYSFVNERIYGFVRLTKFDVDAGRYVSGDLDANYPDGTHHGDSSLDGAIYSLYVDDSNEAYNRQQMLDGGIYHPDGVGTPLDVWHNGSTSSVYQTPEGYAILNDQQVFVDGQWLPKNSVLKVGEKVASAKIIDGELTFDGLYPGNYYIVEEIRDEELLIYKNTRREIRYLSWAPGYTVEMDGNKPLKRSVKIHWNGETTINGEPASLYVEKITDLQSNQKIIPTRIKFTKTTFLKGDETTNHKQRTLQGAGFTIYLLSELSKIKSGEIAPLFSIEQGSQMLDSGELLLVQQEDAGGQYFDHYELASTLYYDDITDLENYIIFVPNYGYYLQRDIWKGYQDPAYSHEKLKYDFSNETNAIARFYSRDTAGINALNQKYWFVPNNGLNGDRTDNPWYGEYGLAEGIPQGTAMKPTTGRTAKQQANEYVVSEIFTNPYGEIVTPPLPYGYYLLVETTLPEDKVVVDPIAFSINDQVRSDHTIEQYYDLNAEDAPFQPYLEIVKRDSHNGQTIKLANTSFRIWDYDRKKFVNVMYKNGSTVVSQSIFTTDDEGRVPIDTIRLDPGKYRIEEITAPWGTFNKYWFNSNRGTPNGPSNSITVEDAVDFYVTTERRWYSAGNYSSTSTYYVDNKLIEVLYIGEHYFNEEVLGKITIQKTGEVLVGYDIIKSIEFKDQYKEVDASGTNQNKTYKNSEQYASNIDEFGVSLDFENLQPSDGAFYTDETDEVDFDRYKMYDFVYEERPLANARFKIIADEDIMAPSPASDPIKWFGKGDTVAVVETAYDGEKMSFVPVYNPDAEFVYPVSTFDVTGKTKTWDKEFTRDDFHTSTPIENYWVESKMSQRDKDLYGIPSFTDEYIYPNSYPENGDINNPKMEVVKIEKNGTLGEVSITLPLGKYKIVEEKAPYGFVNTEYSYFDADKTVQEQIVELTYENQLTQLVFNKNEDSVNRTKNVIKSFIERNLKWWRSGVNTYTAMKADGLIDEGGFYKIGTVSSPDFAGREGSYTPKEDEIRRNTLEPAEDSNIPWNNEQGIPVEDIVFFVDEQGFVNFYNERIKPYADTDKPEPSKKYISIGIFKKDKEDDTLSLAGAKFALFTRDDIYNVDGKLIVPANTRLSTAVTDKNGFAEFEVDVPYMSWFVQPNATDKDIYNYNNAEGVSLSTGGNTAMNTGVFYVVELVPPAGYLYDDTPHEVVFDPKLDNRTELLIPVSTIHSNTKAKVDISKRDNADEKELGGAEFVVYEVFGPNGGRVKFNPDGSLSNENIIHADPEHEIDRWISVANETHTIDTGKLAVSNLNFGRLTSDEIREHVYVIREETPPEGYVGSEDIYFELVQNYTIDENTGETVWDTENVTVYILAKQQPEFVKGSIQAQAVFTDHEGDDPEYNFSHDYIHYINDAPQNGKFVDDEVENDPGNTADDVVKASVVAKWTFIDGTLIIDIENAASVEAVKKSINPDGIIEHLKDSKVEKDDIKAIYFLKNNTLADETVDYLKAKLTDSKFDQEAEGETTNYHFDEALFVDTLPASTAALLDAEALAATEPEVVVLSKSEWVKAKDAYSTERNDATIHYAQQRGKDENAALDKTLVVGNDKTKLFIRKADIQTDLPVREAKLAIINEKGEVVREWTTKNIDEKQESLPEGKYVLKETQVPDESGYVYTASIEFEIKNDRVVNVVHMPDNYTRIKIKKTDIVTGEEIPGAKLRIVDADNNVVVEWTTDGVTPKYIDRLKPGKYKLIEEQTPAHLGYTLSEAIEFEVDVKQDIVTLVEMFDDFTVIDITKVDITNEQEIPGAKLSIWKASENGDIEGDKPLHEWTSTGKPHRIEYLAPGFYILREDLAPTGYKIAQDIKFEVEDKKYHYADDGKTVLRDENGKAIANPMSIKKVVMKDEPTVVFYKVDDEDKPVVGAEFSMYLKSDPNEVIMTWKSDGNPYGIDTDKMIKGVPYVIKETKVPDGYIKAADIEIMVTQPEGERDVRLYKAEKSEYVEIKDGVLKMIDLRTEVDIHKFELGTENKYVVGAQLIVRDMTGAEIDSWTSTNEPHKIKGLVPGTYYLIERYAPEGYKIAEDVQFQITQDNTPSNPLKVVMYDEVVLSAARPQTPTPTREQATRDDNDNKNARRVQTSDDNNLLIFLIGGAFFLAVATIATIKFRKKLH